MKTKRFGLVVLAIAGIAVFGCFAFFTSEARTRKLKFEEFRTALQAGLVEKILAAARAYVDDLKTRNSARPPSVALRELVGKGFLKREDARALDGMDVTLFLTADESEPQKTLLEARLADGTTIVLQSDGSVSMAPAK